MLIFMLIMMFYFGAIMGSFYLVIATRLPKNEDVLVSRSHCDNCKAILKWYQLIPLFSYLFIRKCPKCKCKIPPINFIIEMFTGILFAFIYYTYYNPTTTLGFTSNTFLGLIIASLVVIIFITDFKFLMILDSPLVVASVLCFIIKWYSLGIVEALKSVGTGLIIFIIMYIFGTICSKIFKKEALGGGDIKFSFVLGMILGIKMSFIAIILSAFLALPVSVASLLITKNNEVPFGPFLVGALFIVFVYLEKFNNILIILFSI